MEKKRLIRAVVLASLVLVIGLFFVALCSFLREPLTSLLLLSHRVGDKPAKFGALHLSFLVFTVVLSAFAAILGGRVTKERLDGIVFAFGVLFLLLETYKQAYYHMVLGGGSYRLSVLPLQLCSYVLYLFPVLPLLGEGRVKRLLYGFAALFETVGGAVVMAYPLFYRELALSVYTLVWHTVMVAVGVLILTVRGYGRDYVREVLPSFGIFLTVFLLGLTLNVLLSPERVGETDVLNLFYLSPHGVTNMFLIGDVRDALGLPMAAMTYAVLLFVGANAVWLIGRLVLQAKGEFRRKGGTSCDTE